MSGQAPEEILSREFSDEFVARMRNRMLVSYFKYGRLADAYPHKVDALASLRLRLEKYEATGNTEWLVDAANFAMIEYMLPRRGGAHFRGTDAGESPGRIIAGAASGEPNQSEDANLSRLRDRMARDGD